MREAYNFIKNEALAKVFSCEFCKIFKNSFITEHLWTTASANYISSSLNSSVKGNRKKDKIGLTYSVGRLLLL